MGSSGLLTSAFYLFGLSVSFQDWRQKRVSNAWIFFGLLAAAAGFALREAALPLRRFALHATLSAISAVVLWLEGIWPAGDAKIYFVFAILLVLIHPFPNGLPLLLFFKLLINIFILAGLFVGLLICGEMVLALKYFSWHGVIQKIPLMRRKISRVAMGLWSKRRGRVVSLLNIFAIIFAMTIATSFPAFHSMGGRIFLALEILVAIFWRRVKSVVLGELTAAALWPILALSIFLALKRGLLFSASITALKMMLFFGILLGLFRKVLLQKLAKKTYEFSCAELKPGMVLAPASWRDLFRGLDKDEFLRVYPDGVSAEDISWIRERCAQTGLRDKLLVQSTRPFAFWIFVGCLWTLYEPQNVVQWLLWHTHFLR